MADLPHILIIMPDQLRADTMGCAGHPAVRTPNIDRIARQGMRFTNAITPSPVCMPARASFISGQFPHQHHVWYNGGSIHADEETFFQHLQRAGYRTAHVGKSHYYPLRGKYLPDYEPYMHERGFDYVHEIAGPHANVISDGYMTDRWKRLGLLEEFRADYRSRNPLTVRPSTLPLGEDIDSYVGREAVEYLHGIRGDGPTCTFVGFGGPHEPWDPPGEYAEMYDPADMPAPIALDEDSAGLPEHARIIMGPNVEGLTPEKVTEIRAAYYGKITLIDHWIGRILSVYEERGWLANTLIIFWSDHGEMAGDHNRLFKACYYHGSVDMPLIVRWPGSVHAKTTCDALVQTVDIFPTIMGIIGAETPPRVAGKSLWPLLHDPGQSIRDTAFSEIGRTGNRTVMARTKRYTFALHENGESVHLFDEEQDPEQRNNLVSDPGHSAVVADMRERIFRFLLKEQEVTDLSPRV